MTESVLEREDKLLKYHGEKWHTPKGRMIRDIVYDAIDTGLVTTISFLAGASFALPDIDMLLLAAGAQVSSGLVAIFFGSYISCKAQKEFFEDQIARETRELEESPKREEDEIRDIFAEMGFTKEEREMCVKRITANKDTWLKFMIQEEIGIVPGTMDNPLEIGFISSLGYFIGALPPLISFFFSRDIKIAISWSVLSVLAFLFLLGISKTRFTNVHWLKSGLETLVVGVLSSCSGYGLAWIATNFISR